jgi:hypothetical protein
LNSASEIVALDRDRCDDFKGKCVPC